MSTELSKLPTRNNTAEESKILNSVSKGTPMGEMLRRYWWPVGISAHLKDKPTMVKLLGEELVLFRDRSGNTGLVGAYCPHRLANLAFGTTARDGIMCKYHGWLINHKGKVLATPGESDKCFKDTVQDHPAYPTEELGGLIFAYLGPAPIPALPRFNFLADEGERIARFTGFAQCNWMQTIENGMDPLHLSFLHTDSFVDMRSEPESWFEPHDHGVAYVSVRPSRDDEGMFGIRVHNLLLPAISQTGSTDRWVKGAAASDDPPVTARWAIPMSDTETAMLRIMYLPEKFKGQMRDDVPAEQQWDLPWEATRAAPFKEYLCASDSDNVELGYTMPRGASREDATITESVGSLIAHEKEHLLPEADRGLTMLRQMYLNAVASVQEGQDPPGVMRGEDAQKVIKPRTGERVIDAEEYARLRVERNVSSSVVPLKEEA